MKVSLSQLKSWVSNGDISASISGNADANAVGVTTDSRNVNPGNLFIALRGERFDAHDFLPDVVTSGAAAVLVERMPARLSVPALVVPDTRIALGEIAHHWRQQFTLPVIGVTGSNGKTTVKEMIAAILEQAFGDGNYLATRGNLNNEIGVPLTLLRLTAEHRAAVVELGMNHIGEIALLASIAQPTVSLVNNAQREHQEFMQSVEAVARENGAVIEALPEDGVAVFPADDAYTSLWRNLAAEKGQCKVVTFGLTANSDVTCSYQAGQFGSDMVLDIQGLALSVKLSAAGLHNVRNALAAAASCHAIEIPADAIAAGLESFAPVNGRMQRKSAINGAVVIDDTYNANPDSVLAAIDVLAQAQTQAQALRVLVLGDMGEVGREGSRFHKEVGVHARQSGIEYLLTLGDLAQHSTSAFGAGATHFNDLEDLMQSLKTILVAEATVLVKGSRFMRMERVVQQLVNEQKAETY